MFDPKKLGGAGPVTALTPTEDELNPFVLDTSKNLSKKDLQSNQYINHIRDYMVARKGVGFEDVEDEKLVDDFMRHMRFFSANIVSTAGEAAFVARADDTDREKARRAFKIYEQTGNFFNNDGVGGIVDGAWDYVSAVASDPSNYLGLITGGVARAAAGGAQITGKKAVQSAVRMAGMKAAQSKTARDEARDRAIMAGERARRETLKNRHGLRKAENVARQVEQDAYRNIRRGFAQTAMREAQEELFKAYDKKALFATVAMDASLAVLNDVQYQGVRMEVGAQEEYSTLQTGFSSLFGLVAGGAQLLASKAKGASGLANQFDYEAAAVEQSINRFVPKLSKKESKEAAKAIDEELLKWEAKVKEGSFLKSGDDAEVELIKAILIGEDGKGGVGRVIKASKKYKIDDEIHVSDFVTNVIQNLDDKSFQKITNSLRNTAGVHLGDLTRLDRITLRDLIANRMSRAGRTLNIMSQVQRYLDNSVVLASDRASKDAKALQKLEDDALAEGPNRIGYAQNVWKRLLVASPGTTGLNILGFSSYASGQTLADLFSAGGYGVAALGQLVVGNQKGFQETMRRANVLKNMTAERLKLLADPFTTFDAYTKLIAKFPKQAKELQATIGGSGIVGDNLKRMGITEAKGVYKWTEAYASASQIVSGVSVQDAFTKSQMFMAEMNKQLQLKHKTTLSEVIRKGQEGIIDDDIMGQVLDVTMRSVASKNFTTDETPALLRGTAKLVETISNTPGLGTVLPFGRFMNNVVSLSYQWSPLAAPEVLVRFGKRIAKREAADLDDMNTLSRFMVGSTAIGMAMNWDKERREKGLAWNEVEAGSGTIVDGTNTFPVSVMLIAGRIGNLISEGEEVPGELYEELAKQVAVGQLVKSTQFGTDLNAIINAYSSGTITEQEAFYKGIAKGTGNVMAGYTRPLDALNRMVGFVSGTDAIRDIRQEDDAFGTFTNAAGRYTENIFDILVDRIEAVSDADLGGAEREGKELRVATREGEVYDPNPFARIFGLKIIPGKTATEQAYSMADMMAWRDTERTKIHGYDRAFNVLIAPVLERRTARLIRTDAFKNGTGRARRQMLKRLVSDTKSMVRDYMRKGGAGEEEGLEALRAQASRRGNKAIRKEALELMNEQYGVRADIRELSYDEIQIFLQLVKSLERDYDAVESL
jgi:hypothetical protein